MASKTRPSSTITAELQGGVGNQLFVLIAGIAQASRLDVPLVLDISRLGTNTNLHVQRDFELSPLIELIDYPISIAPARIREQSATSREILTRLPGTRYFKEPSLDYSESINEIKPGAILTGYFQSPSYFTHGSDKLMGAALEGLAKSLGITPGSDVFMHIRRGDYLIPKHQNHHGLATLDYFDRGAKLMRLHSPNANFRIFTDSPDQIPVEFISKWGATLDTNQLNLTPLEALLSLSANNGLIMSNSSFSWWAAWLAEQRNSDAMFIAPRPWLASGASGHTLLPSHWITLGA